MLERRHDTASKGYAVEIYSTVLSHLTQQTSFSVELSAHNEYIGAVQIRLYSGLKGFLRLPQSKNPYCGLKVGPSPYKRSFSHSELTTHPSLLIILA